MTRIVIELAPIEMGFHHEAYELFVADLEQAGFEAELRSAAEERFGLPQEIVNTVVWLGDRVADSTAEIIIGMYLERMRRSRHRRKKPPPRAGVAEFRMPGDQTWRTVEIPEREDD